MIRIIPVSNLEKSNDHLQQIFIDSFPPQERREWKEMQKLMDRPNFILNQVLDNKQLIGLITLWNLPDFTFIEHFAISKSFQGKGIGSQVIRQITEAKPKKIILEVDEPTTELAKRRLTFYERLGFYVCDGSYWQPPYSADKEKVKMLLLSYPDPIHQMEFTEIKRHIYREVYLLNDYMHY